MSSGLAHSFAEASALVSAWLKPFRWKSSVPFVPHPSPGPAGEARHPLLMVMAKVQQQIRPAIQAVFKILLTSHILISL